MNIDEILIKDGRDWTKEERAFVKREIKKNKNRNTLKVKRDALRNASK